MGIEEVARGRGCPGQWPVHWHVLRAAPLYLLSRSPAPPPITGPPSPHPHPAPPHPAVLGDFRQQEHLIGSQLGGLNRDVAWLKAYAVGALVVTKEAMQARARPAVSNCAPHGCPQRSLRSLRSLRGGR